MKDTYRQTQFTLSDFYRLQGEQKILLHIALITSDRKKNQCLFIDCQPNGFYDMNTKKKKRKILGVEKRKILGVEKQIRTWEIWG